MDRDEFTIASATGVDVALDVAGPGSRSYAFIIDWHFRVLVALAWYLVGSILVTGHAFPDQPQMQAHIRLWTFGAVLPAFAIYVLYHPVLEIAMGGRTPGKRMAGVRIVSDDGGAPSAGALLIRNIFRLIDALPALYLVGLTTTIFTAKRVRIGDLAARTLLVNDRATEIDALADLSTRASQTHLDPRTLELAREVLRRWKELERTKRIELARSLLARIEPGADPAELAALTENRLQGRLEYAIGGEVKA